MYSSGILVEEIWSAVERIDEWLGKPVVITCDEMTAMQLPQVVEHVKSKTRVKYVVFNTRLEDMKANSDPSIHKGNHSCAGGSAMLEGAGTTVINKIQVFHISMALSEIRTLFSLNNGSMPYWMIEEILVRNWCKPL